MTVPSILGIDYGKAENRPLVVGYTKKGGG